MSGNPFGPVRLGVGFYTVPEAARLLGIPAMNIRRWLGGYTFRRGDRRIDMAPLWEPQLPAHGQNLYLGFRDLIELRFVKAFKDAGLGLLTIRRCLDYARDIVGDDRPFSTRRFRTDGRTIFLESASDHREELIDLRGGQFALRRIIEVTFRDLDIDDDAVSRWRPYRGRESIVLDPLRSFGQPIASESGVPTVALAEAVDAEGSINRVAALFEIPATVVRDALGFEAQLRAA